MGLASFYKSASLKSHFALKSRTDVNPERKKARDGQEKWATQKLREQGRKEREVDEFRSVERGGLILDLNRQRL
jgi:hypothetical protein